MSKGIRLNDTVTQQIVINSCDCVREMYLLIIKSVRTANLYKMKSISK